MSENIFDSLKTNKNKSAGEKRRKSRELSPVKFPFSDDEDSDEVFLKSPTKPSDKKQQMSATTKRLLGCMRKCAVKLPLDKNGRRNYRIPGIKKPRKLVVRLNKNSVKSLTKGKPSKVPEKLKTPESRKQAAKVYVKFPLSTPNSNRRKRCYLKTPMKAHSSDSAMKESKPFKRLHATPPLVREFGKRFFMSYVAVENCNFQMMIKDPNASVSPPKKKKLNSSVRFNETVKVFGSSSSDEELSDPMPVSLVTAINGGDDFDATTPSPSLKGKRSLSLKKKTILTPAAKKNYRLSDEKKVSVDNDVEEDEDDNAEYIIPTEISPLKKQPSPSHQASTQKSTSPLRSEPSLLYDDNSEKSAEITETIIDDVERELEITTTTATTTEKFELGKDNKQSTLEVTDSVREFTPEPVNEDDDDDDERIYSSMQENSNNEEDKTGDDSKNHSHNVFEDDDSQGQNIVQDFISRTVQDLSHDDSEDIQDDEELVDEKRSSPPSATNDDDSVSVSSKISRICQNVKEHFLGVRNISQGKKDTDNVNTEP